MHKQSFKSNGTWIQLKCLCHYLYLYISLQISTFLRTNIMYDQWDAYAIVLNKVPGLDSVTKKKRIRDFVKVKTSPSRGLVSNPRSFLPDHLGDQEQVQ